MAKLNSNIILAGSQPDVVGAFDRGQQAGARGNAIQQQNRLAQVFQTQGPGIAAGDPGALNALAAIDPMASIGVQDQRQQMQARSQQMEMLTREEQRLLQDRAAAMSAAERAAAAEQQRQVVAMGLAINDPAQWDAFVTQQGATDLVGQFENRQMLANRFLEMADIIEGLNGPDPLSPEGKFAVDQRRGFIPDGVTSSGGGGAKDQEIQRTMQAWGVDFKTAQGIADGVLRVSQDPTTREIMVTNLATGETFAPTVSQGMPGQQPAQEQSAPTTQQPAGNPTFGDAFQGAANSFGFQGVARGLANTGADALGFEVPFPEDQQTRQDFEVLGESLVNDFASAYGRQPPSWLLQNIAGLVPQAGRPFEGPQRAQTKLVSIARDMESRRRVAQESLRRRLTPAERQEALALIAGIDATLARVNSALQGFQSGGSDADDALMQKYLGAN
ncbi:MAG: hypothetical protein ACU0CT_02710 [Paracoccaceae bacterium]